MAELSTETSLFPYFTVVVDSETRKILDTDPKKLLGKIFNNDPYRIFALEDTGFTMHDQLQNWFDAFNQAVVSGKSLETIRQQFFDRTIEDVVGFYHEYLSGQDIFPLPYSFKINENGEKIIYAEKYGKTIQQITLDKERDGSMSKGVNAAVNVLINSDPGTVVIVNSPPGWSGLNEQGHPDTQSYVFWIREDGNLDCMTIRTDTDLIFGEKLTGINNTDLLSTKDRIKKVVESPIKIKVDENGFDEALNLIEKNANKYFPKIRNEINKRATLFNMNDEARKIISDLKTFLIENVSDITEANIKVFVVAVGKAILDLSEKALENKLTKKSLIRTIYQNNVLGNRNTTKSFDHYRAILEQVREIEGCNGGGKTSKNSTDSSSEAVLQQMETSKVCKGCGTTEGVVCGWCKSCWEAHGNK